MIMHILLLTGSPKHTEVNVDVEVMDENDNDPVLDNAPREILISEATLVGTQIFTITATDRDIGNNGKFYFYGFSPDRKFSINNKTGAVHTTSTFDFETRKRLVISANISSRAIEVVCQETMPHSKTTTQEYNRYK